MTHPKIQVAWLTWIQVFPAWLIFDSFPDKLLLSSARSETTVKINTVYFLPQGEDLKPHVTTDPHTLFFLPLDGATQKRSYSFVCIMRKPQARWPSSVNAVFRYPISLSLASAWNISLGSHRRTIWNARQNPSNFCSPHFQSSCSGQWGPGKKS